MNIYFYSARENRCKENCSYHTCPERYLHALQYAPPATINSLPYEALLNPTVHTPLRSGDLIILHIEDHYELDLLVKKRKMFEHCRLIIITSKDVYENSRSYHLLSPRFITTSEQSPADLRNVVYKLIALSNSWENNSYMANVSLPQTIAR